MQIFKLADFTSASYTNFSVCPLTVILMDMGLGWVRINPLMKKETITTLRGGYLWSVSHNSPHPTIAWSPKARHCTCWLTFSLWHHNRMARQPIAQLWRHNRMTSKSHMISHMSWNWRQVNSAYLWNNGKNATCDAIIFTAPFLINRENIQLSLRTKLTNKILKSLNGTCFRKKEWTSCQPRSIWHPFHDVTNINSVRRVHSSSPLQCFEILKHLFHHFMYP